MSTLTLALKSFHDLFYHLFWKFDPQSSTIFDLFGLIICLFINIYLFFKPIAWKAVTNVTEGGGCMIEPPFFTKSLDNKRKPLWHDISKLE